MSEPSDEELMQAYQRGEVEALRTLFVRHASRLQAFFWCMLADPAQAEELGQRTWLRLHRLRKSYAPPLSFVSWLYSLAVQIRRDSAREQVVHASQPGAARSVTDAPSLTRALHDLPDSYREVVVLHRLVGLRFSEIALVLGATESAVQQRTQQGYSQLLELTLVPSDKTQDPEQAAKEVFAPALFAGAIEPAVLEHHARALFPLVVRETHRAHSPWTLLVAFVVVGVLGALWWFHLVP